MVTGRQAAVPAQDAEDEILEKPPSHPVATTLLIVSAVALLVAIALSMDQLGQYVNPETRRLTNGFTKSAVAVGDEEAQEFAEKYGIKSWNLDQAAERE